jgi:hypothetical protein
VDHNRLEQLLTLSAGYVLGYRRMFSHTNGLQCSYQSRGRRAFVFPEEARIGGRVRMCVLKTAQVDGSR